MYEMEEIKEKVILVGVETGGDEPAETSLDELAELGAESEDLGVLDALMALPEKYRAVLTLHYVEGYGTAEIAGMIGRTPSAVKMRLKKGRELLETELGKECE